MSIALILWMSSVAVLLHKAQSSITIEADLSAQVVRVGDNVTFTCKLTELGAKTVTLEKAVTDSDAKKIITEQIAINDQLNRLYKNLNRFSVVRSTVESADVLTLRITGVQLEDSGNYGCDVSVDNKFAFKVLEVYRKPKNISLFLDNQLIANGSMITVKETQNPLNIVCRVSEVVPEPSLEIRVERGMVAPKNITGDFVIVTRTDVHCSESSPDKTCPLHLSHAKEATNRDFNVSFIHDSQKLTCVSKIKEFEMEEVATEVTLNVLYIPKILCAGLWNVTLDMPSLEIRCRVYANPVSNSSDKHVTIDEKGMMVKVNPGDDFQSYSLQDEVEKGTNGKNSTMIFTIKTVTEEHFNYTYTFYARNSEGLTEKRIRIEKTATPIIDGAEGILKRRVPFPVVILASFAILFCRL